MDIAGNAKKNFAKQKLNINNILIVIIILIITLYIIKSIIRICCENCNRNINRNGNKNRNINKNRINNNMEKMASSNNIVSNNIVSNNIVSVSNGNIVEKELDEDYFDKLYYFINISQDNLFPTKLYFCSVLKNVKYYLGYIPAAKCISNSPSLNCLNYNIVLELLDDFMTHNNCEFSIFKPVNSKKSYMIGTNSIFNKNDYIRLSSSLLNSNSITNACGDVGEGTHKDWNVYFIQRTIAFGNDPPLYNICFVVKNKLYYLTFADDTVEPCGYKYQKNGREYTSVFHKVALTPVKILALDFIISNTRPF